MNPEPGSGHDDIAAFLSTPDEGLISGAGVLAGDIFDSREYGAFLLPEFFEDDPARFGADFVKETWREIGDPDDLGADDAIKTQLLENGVTLGGVLPEFWRRNYRLSPFPDPFLGESFGDYKSAALSDWQNLLDESGPVTAADDHAGPRPARQVLDLVPGTTMTGETLVEPGGAAFLDIVHNLYQQAPLTLQVKNFAPRPLLPDTPTPDDVDLTLYSFADYPNLCQAPIHLSLSSSGVSSPQALMLAGDCSFSTLVITNTNVDGDPKRQEFAVSCAICSDGGAGGNVTEMVTGFEHGLFQVTVAAREGMFFSSGGNVSVQGGVVKSGNYALRLQSSSSTATWARRAIFSVNLNDRGSQNDSNGQLTHQACTMGQVYVRFATVPDASGPIFSVGQTTYATYETDNLLRALMFYYDQPSGRLKLKYWDAQAWTDGSSAGPVLAANTWYRIDFRDLRTISADGYSSTTLTVDWKVNGAAMPTFTDTVSTIAASGLTFVDFGTYEVGGSLPWTGDKYNADIYFDDVVLVDATPRFHDSLWPLPTSSVSMLVPNTDGTHAGVGNFSTSSTPSYQNLDEIPVDTSTSGDAIVQTIADASSWLEYGFQDLVGSGSVTAAELSVGFAAAGAETAQDRQFIDLSSPAESKVDQPIIGLDTQLSGTRRWRRYGLMFSPDPSGTFFPLEFFLADYAYFNQLMVRYGRASDVSPNVRVLSMFMEVAT